VPDKNIATGRRDDHHAQHATQPGRGESNRRDRIAEEVSEPEPGTRPEQYSADLVDDEPRASDPSDAGQRRHQRGKPRYKFWHEEESGAVAGQSTLRSADVGIRPKRHPADFGEHGGTPAAP